MIQVRAATLDDAPELQRIYAHHVLHGTGTYEETPPDVEEMAARMRRIMRHGWPFLLAEADDEVVGYAYCAQLRDRTGYRFSAEDAVYVRDDMRGRKVGRQLLEALLSEAEAFGFRQVFAFIGDAANAGSIGLHAAMGFVETGRLRRCGIKFGQWLDVVIMQRALGPADAAIPPA